MLSHILAIFYGGAHITEKVPIFIGRLVPVLKITDVKRLVDAWYLKNEVLQHLITKIGQSKLF